MFSEFPELEPELAALAVELGTQLAVALNPTFSGVKAKIDALVAERDKAVAELAELRAAVPHGPFRLGRKLGTTIYHADEEQPSVFVMGRGG